MTIIRMNSGTGHLGVPHRPGAAAELMMYLEDMVLELMKNDVSLPWIWIPTKDYTDHAQKMYMKAFTK